MDFGKEFSRVSTPARRRLVCLIVCAIAGVQTLGAATRVLPVEEEHWWPGTTEPVLKSWSLELPRWAWPLWSGEVPDAPFAQRHQLIDPLQPDLDRIVEAMSGPRLPAFVRMPHNGFSNDAPGVLGLRGLWRLEAGDPRGVDDLIAAGRLARAVEVPVPGNPAQLPVIHGVRAETVVLAMLERALRSRSVAHADAGRLRVEMARWGRESRTYPESIRAEIAWARHVLAVFGETGRAPYASGAPNYAALGWWLPHTGSGRRAAAAALADELAALKEAELADVLAGRQPEVDRARDERIARGAWGRPEIFGVLVPPGTTRAEFLAACVSTARGHALALRLLDEKIVYCARRGLAEYRGRDRQYERVAAMLAAP